MCEATGVGAQLSLPFPGGKSIVRKKVKTQNTCDNMTPIVFSLSPYVLENNRLLNKSYWDDLDIVVKVIVRETFRNFAYISAILASILTNFRQQ